MKKTFFLSALVASCGLAYSVESLPDLTLEESVAMTFTTKTGGIAGNGNYSGVSFTLSYPSSRLDFSCEGRTEFPGINSFSLESISVKVRSGNAWTVATGAYLMDGVSNTVLAHATNTIESAAAESTVTFNFGDLTQTVILNPNTVYKLVFVDADDINGASIAVGNVVNSSTSALHESRGLAGYKFSGNTLSSECGLLNSTNPLTYRDSEYAPVLTITGRANIPEPMTATLSLLALAGLAARRRRS